MSDKSSKLPPRDRGPSQSALWTAREARGGSDESNMVEDHVEIARGGAKAIDEWRRANATSNGSAGGSRSGSKDGSPKVVLSLKGADLHGVDLSGADLTDADFTEADLRGADLTGAKLVRTRFDEADLSDAWLGSTRIEAASFVRTKIGGATFDGAMIRAGDGAGFHEVTGKGAMFRGARFSKSQMVKCRLIEPDFTEAVVDDCDFQSVRITRGRFDRAAITRSNFSWSNFVDCVFDGAEFDALEGESMKFAGSSFEDCATTRSPALDRRIGRATKAAPANARGDSKRKKSDR